jgi:hypothetical protein
MEMKKMVILGLIVLGLISCASTQSLEQDTRLKNLKTQALRSIELFLSDEKYKDEKFYPNTFWSQFVSSARDLVIYGKHNPLTNIDKLANMYMKDMGDFIDNLIITHTENIDNHNTRIDESLRERLERNEILKNRQRIVLANGVSGNERWITFQQDFDPITILILISGQRNNSTANTVLTQLSYDMDRRYRGIQPLTEEQNEWYQAIGTYIFFEIGIVTNPNLTNPHGQEATILASVL